VSRNASAADDATAISAAEARSLFDDLNAASTLVLAVSGGPDSTALLVLAARWRAALRQGPALLAVTIDHGLRPESAREARAVKRLAGRLGVQHRTLRWTGAKPATGLQEAARQARYRLLAQAARDAGATYVLTGHTRDDQAETVLFRMARGSGLTGLGGMARETRLEGVTIVRPLLERSKAQLIATLATVGIAFADDPSNRDPRFTRPRLRAFIPALTAEGLDASRFALLARRLRRAEETIEVAVDAAAAAVAGAPWPDGGPVVFDAAGFLRLPAEAALRLLGRAITSCGDEGPVQLGKLEALFEEFRGALTRSQTHRLRRTLAGALIALAGDRMTVERAPSRSAGRKSSLTTRPHGRRNRDKAR
jgi:tRNA(Ile)-lysidine synthase